MTTHNMIPPVKDRNYYNMLDDEELLHFVRYPQPDRTDWHELAIVLAERLKRQINIRDCRCPACDD